MAPPWKLLTAVDSGGESKTYAAIDFLIIHTECRLKGLGGNLEALEERRGGLKCEDVSALLGKHSSDAQQHSFRATWHRTYVSLLRNQK